MIINPRLEEEENPRIVMPETSSNFLHLMADIRTRGAFVDFEDNNHFAGITPVILRARDEEVFSRAYLVVDLRCSDGEAFQIVMLEDLPDIYTLASVDEEYGRVIAVLQEKPIEIY